MNCPRCRSWETKAGDRHCSLCRAELFDSVQLYVSRTAPQDSVARLALRNDTAADVTYTYEAAGEDWLRIQPPEDPLGPGAPGTATFRLNLGMMGGPAMRAGFVTELQGGTFSREIKVEAYPEPREVKVEDLVVHDQAHDAELTVVSESPLVVTGITFDVNPALAELHVTELPVKLRAGKNRVPVSVRPLRRGEATVNMRLATVLCDFAADFRLRVMTPPTVDAYLIKGQPIVVECQPDEERVLKLNIENDGDSKLEISAMHLTKDSPEITWHHAFEPCSLAPHAVTAVDLTLATSLAAQDTIPSRLQFRSNDPVDRTFDIIVRIVEPPFSHCVALDYGTTVSAVAICTGAPPQNIGLENSHRRIDSGVYIRSSRLGRNPPYDWIIGTNAKSLGSAPGGRERYIKAAKTKVGTGEKLPPIPVGRTLESIAPETVAQMAIMELLRLTRLGLQQRPTRVVFTAPTRFTLKQRHALARVFAEAANAKGIRLRGSVAPVDESFAAGYYYLLFQAGQDTQLRERTDYTLVVMDFGGGTTDVTMFRVFQEPGDAQRPPCPTRAEILGAWGDQKLGGEALTQSIARFLAKQFGEADGQYRRLEDQAEALKLAVSEYLKKPTDTPNAVSPMQDDSVMRTECTQPQAQGQVVQVPPMRDDSVMRPALFYLANGQPGELSADDYQDALARMDTDRVVKVFYKDAPGEHETEVPLDEVLNLCRSWLSGFEQEMKYFRDKVNIQSIAAGRTAANNGRLADKLLLCGQTSLLPVVPEVFKPFADSTDYVRDEHGNLMLKECVSLGAAAQGEATGHGLPIDGLECWWRVVGKATPIPGQGFAFEELIPWGASVGTGYVFDLSSRSISSEGGGPGCIRVDFTLQENLSLGRKPVPVDYRTYFAEIPRELQDQFDGKLALTSEGEIEVYCCRGRCPRRPTDERTPVDCSECNLGQVKMEVVSE
ncbi:MAG: Hsp70 family protein [candidate division WOR-3 bacterium]|nr:Hsp70 family protein [candidate division WOR-3 bacterium]